MTRVSSPKELHIALFPFMSKGHTIPLLHFAKLIHQHRPYAKFTIFTTPSNEPFIKTSLSSLSSEIFTVVSLPFHACRVNKGKGGTRDYDSDNNGIPEGVESTDQLPSMALFHSFVYSLESLQPLFETTLENIQKRSNPITFLICDSFLYWTHNVTPKFNVPTLYFSGMNMYVMAISHSVYLNDIFDGVTSMDEPVQVPGFREIRLTRNDFDKAMNGPDANPLANDFLMKVRHAVSTCYGFVVNSFEELESEFLTYCNSGLYPKFWCVGPFCLVEKPIEESFEAHTPLCTKWLNKTKEDGKQVLYVAFGTQAEITNEQLKEIALGLERSGVNFLWALRIKPAQEEVIEGFEERVKDRGLIVRGWVEQRAILEHESVQGFLSHCGWNSVIESVCASVPILAWPIMADQHLNARTVVEEMKVGLRVETSDRSVRGFVKWEGLCKMVVELMKGELGKEVRNNVNDFSLAAKKAIEEGGSSWASLDALLNELEANSS